MADLQDLFARLKSSGSNTVGSPHDQQASYASNASRNDLHGNRPPSISSPLFSPPLSGPQPQHPSAVKSPNVSSMAGTPGPDPTTSDRSMSLLNLLKFTQPGLPSSQLSRQSGGSAEGHTSSHALPSNPSVQNTASNRDQTVSASDLVASFIPKPPTSAAYQATPVPSAAPIIGTAASIGNPQDYLLKLLNQPKSAQSDVSRRRTSEIVKLPEMQAPEAITDDVVQDFEDASLEKVSSGPRASKVAETREDSPMRIFGSASSSQPAQQAANKSAIFNYKNPFEELSASSPRNRTPRPDERAATPKVDILKFDKDGSAEANGGNLRRGLEKPTLPAPKSRKTDATQDVSSGVSSPVTSSLPHGRSRVEAPMEIDTERQEPESVSEALNEVGERVDKQVTEALDKLVIAETAGVREELERPGVGSQVTAKAVHEAAVDMQEALKDPEVRKVVEREMPKAIADAFEGVTDEVAQDKAQDDWESTGGDESADKDDEDQVVHVFNFPMRPFVTISIKKMIEPPPQLRQDVVMEIARCKKTFDQIDRTLATASNTFIVYAIPKDGGFRVIRQDSGKDKQVFRSAHDRIFNLAICKAPIGTPTAGMETIVATGVSGSVYWTILTNGDEASSEQWENLEDSGLIFPPSVAQADNSSGGQLKTRAKQSSRHPEFFAIAWGKSIYLMWPYLARTAQYADEKTRVVDTNKVMKQHSLKITIGKAAKDFCFSEDDTVIVSIDKAGKLKFWDIRELVESPSATPGEIKPSEVKQPLITFLTVPPAEKLSLTSVMFVDKERPVTKGVALRYVIAGMKQNHTLQLWDLGLGKPVQELDLPHEKETDAICSIKYHARSGIIAIGHPTRNSIYFIHVSAPRYNLPNMTQAKYLQRLAMKDPTLPKPDSTAIMSGVREYSFGSKSRLLSLDMLSTPNNPPDGFEGDEAVIFELYVMHTKGVTCLNVRRQDLGWSSDNKVLHPVDAEAQGSIMVEAIRVVPESVGGEETTNDTASTGPAAISQKPAAPASIEKPAKDTPEKDGTLVPRSPHTQKPEPAARPSSIKRPIVINPATANGTGKGAENRKAKTESSDAGNRPTQEPPAISKPLKTPVSYASAVQGPKSPRPQSATVSSHDIKPPTVSPLDATKPEILAPLQKVLQQELQAIYRRFDEDKRVQDATGTARQEAVLRLVSSTLAENVEKSLARVVSSTIEQSVLPTISNVTVASVDRKLQEVLTSQLHSSIPRELKVALPAAISRALQEPEVLRTISDLVANKVAAHVETEFSAVLHSTITPAFKNLALDAATKMSREIETRVAEQIRHSDVQRHQDSQKIDQLTALVQSLTDTVTTMATAQAELKRELLEARLVPAEAREVSVRSASPTVVAPKSAEEEELEEITQLMASGSFEDGTVRWLQSPNQAYLWEQLFVRCNPAYLRRLSPLVSLSVAATVSATFETHLSERLSWLENIYAAMNLAAQEPELQEVGPRIMDLLSRRLQGAFMTVAERDPTNPELRRIRTPWAPLVIQDDDDVRGIWEGNRRDYPLRTGLKDESTRHRVVIEEGVDAARGDADLDPGDLAAAVEDGRSSDAA